LTQGVSVTCRQCQDPACQAACLFDAISYDDNLKIVRVDEEKCTSCRACVGACPFGIITMDPATDKAIKCDLCRGAEPACVAICPSSVLGALDDEGVSEYNQRRYAAVLAFDDEVSRNMPGGEDAIMRKLEIRS
jgi:carbon-monoxide dehydrogenase iron sulfur subunit